MSDIVKIFQENKNGRDFVIGDLHGNYKSLQGKMIENSFDKSVDRLFSVGDLIDRGGESRKCAELIYEPWFHAVKGNHEALMIAAIKGNNSAASECWIYNGGLWATDEPKNEMEMLANDLDELPYYITIQKASGNIGICHAEPPFDDWSRVVESDESALDKAIWGREIIQKKEIQNTKNVRKTYHGHTPNLEGIVTLGTANFIDTGAVFSRGYLTMIQI